ncbi:hypothetical protein FHW69_001622 [Luteibacter sp. Sphag1AF]|nr:hypothetical protein [Luteibacter sp. Sphag1AF]
MNLFCNNKLLFGISLQTVGLALIAGGHVLMGSLVIGFMTGVLAAFADG